MTIQFDQATITLIAQAVKCSTDQHEFFQKAAHLGLADHETRDAARKLVEYIANDAP